MPTFPFFALYDLLLTLADTEQLLVQTKKATPPFHVTQQFMSVQLPSVR
jgi:hypothetical protein